MNPPDMSKVIKEDFLFLGNKSSFKLPNLFLPKTFKNDGNYIISLANLCRWLSEEAAKLEIEIYLDFPLQK